MSEENLSTKQTAKFLGTSTRILEDMRRTGRGPKYIKIGYRTVRYRKSDLLEWLEQKTFSNNASENN